MRFLGVGKSNDLGSLYHRLADAGHEVRVAVEDEASAEALTPPIARAADWRAECDWLREAGRDGVVVFENTGFGAEADRLRAEGVPVIGGSRFGDRLEDDRAFGQDMMREAGMQVAESWAFQDFDAAIGFVRERPARYVFKISGNDYAPAHTLPSELADGRDMIGVLEWQRERWRGETTDFVLMERLDGAEVGTGAYFNGRRFLRPACIDWEHKRFFPGDLGEMTGEMGTLVSYRGSEALFDATLGRLEARLRAAGHVGYVNVNSIVNAHGIFPLEFTCRFGYPGFAILEPLQRAGWADLFTRMLDPDSTEFPTEDGFCLGVVLTIPPYPYQTDYADTARGLPVLFRAPPGPEDWRNIHLCDVARDGERLRTTGEAGYLMVVTGTGATAEAARDAAYARVQNVVVPKLRYRNDIGARFLRDDADRLRALGMLPA